MSLVTTEPNASPLLSREDVRRLDERHVICCHSYTHRRLEASFGDAERRREIVEAKTHLEQRLGHQVPAFVWVRGEEWSYSREAAKTVRDAGRRRVNRLTALGA